MGDLLHYESDNTTIVELLEQGIHFSHHLLSHFNIQQGQRFPVITQVEETKVHMLQWGIENPIIAEGPRLSYIYGPSIEKQEGLRKIYRHQRVLIPVNKFIHRRSGNEPNVIIKPYNQRILWMAGIWYEGGQGEKGFGIITHNSLEEQRKQIRRIPIFLNQQQIINKWLDTSFTNIPDINKLMAIKTDIQVSQETMDMAEL